MPVNVPARATSRSPSVLRCPSVEGFLDGARTQSYIHDILLRVHSRRTSTNYRIFFKRHVLLPGNPHLGHAVSGDILVMRAASKNVLSFINLRSPDARLLDEAVKS